VDQSGADARAGPRDVFGARGVDRIRAILVRLGAVDVGVGRAIDHNIAALHDPLRRVGVGDVPLGRRQRRHLTALAGGLGGQTVA
jgi:hypothetical protein